MGWWEASLNWLRRASKCGKTSLINVVEVKHISDMLLFFLFRMLDIVKTWIRLYGMLVGNQDSAALGNVLFTLESFCPAADGRTWTLSKEALTDEMGLQLFTDREVCSFMISCKNNANIDEVFDWLLKHSKSNKFLSLLCCVPR
ncbi:hypothetical protein Bca101_087779 [Brassica carinata]